VTAGLRSFARSPSPDRAKNIVPSVLSVSPWLVKAYIELWYLQYAELNEQAFMFLSELSQISRLEETDK